MPREIVVRYTCSFCGGDSFDASQFVSFTIAAADGTKVAELPKPLGLDACKACMEAEPVSTLLKVGYPLAKPTGKAPKVPTPEAVPGVVVGDDFTCPECRQPFSSKGGLSQHRMKIHGAVTKTAQEVAARGTGDLMCPECAAEGITWGAKKGQGLGAHRRSVHGVKSPRAS